MYLAIILTGGQGGNSNYIIYGAGTTYCTLPPFPPPSTPETIQGHSQSGLVACGGTGNPGGCYTFTNGQWVASHSLSEQRTYHVSWQTERVSSISSGGGSSEGGILLFGGWDGVSSTGGLLRSTEFVSASSSSTTQLFTLDYDI